MQWNQRFSSNQKCNYWVRNIRNRLVGVGSNTGWWSRHVREEWRGLFKFPVARVSNSTRIPVTNKRGMKSHSGYASKRRTRKERRVLQTCICNRECTGFLVSRMLSTWERYSHAVNILRRISGGKTEYFKIKMNWGTQFQRSWFYLRSSSMY
jgi:hypothetical protein